MRVLIAEDEKKVRDFLATKLKPDGFAVDTAEDGDRGLYLAKLNDYDVVILKHALPHKNGREICEAIRAAGKTMPVVIISASQEVQNKVDLLDAGADDYVTKPFSIEELRARIRALLRRPKIIEHEILCIENIELNTRTHDVTISGNLIKLTRKEFMLLRYFLRHKGIVLSRGMIMEHVWDMNADLFSNTIEAHIVSLRKKIKDREQNIIQTVSGRGYKIIDSA